MLLIATTVVAFLCFQLIVIYTASQLDGACMFMFWAPSLRPEFSPYWMFVGIAILLTLLVGAWMTNALLNQSQNRRVIVAIGCALFVFLAFWAWRLLMFWQLFLFEANLQTSEYWLSVFRSGIESHANCELRF